MKITHILVASTLGFSVAIMSGCGGGKDAIATPAADGGSTNPSDGAASGPANGGGQSASSENFNGPGSSGNVNPQTGRSSRSEVALSNFTKKYAFLDGTDIDGTWPLDTTGKLVPSITLRRRFDYLLLALGKEEVSTIGELLKTLAQEELSPSNAQAVIELWAKYYESTGVVMDIKLEPKDPSSVEAYIAALKQRHVSILGEAWASAFYDADYNALRLATQR